MGANLMTGAGRPLVAAWIRRAPFAYALVVIVAAALAGNARAQVAAAASSEAANASAGNQLQEIIVTAERRQTPLEKTPVAVQVISSQQLVSQGITSDQDLQGAVPGLTVRETSSSNQLSFDLRGQAQDAFSYTSPTVLTYVDELQVGGVTSNALFDLQSVQVLKGPQGTLFGRNATGGAILYQTVEPSQKFGGYARLDAGNYGDREAQAAVNLPLSPIAAVRIAGDYQFRNGYQHNLYLNMWANSINARNGRVTLLLTPTGGLTNSTMFQYGRYGGYSGALKLASAYAAGQTNNGTPLNATSAELYPPNNPLVNIPGFNGILDFLQKEQGIGFYDVYNTQTSSHDALARTGVNTTTFDFSRALEFKNIVGYNRVYSDDQTNIDGAPYQALVIGVTPGLSAEGYSYDTEQYSEEFHLSGLIDNDRLNYIAGLYYGRDDEGQNIPLCVACDYPAAFTALTGLPETFRYDFQTQEISKAFYLQGEYKITDRLRFTAGYRQTWEHVTIVHRTGAVPEDTYALIGVPNGTLRESKPSWTLGLNYQLTPQWMLYIAQRGSFRAGGFNGTSDLPLPSGGFTNDSFKPETTWDVEVGSKYAGTLAGLPARLNVDVYDQHVHDIQRAVYIGIAAETSNAQEAEVTGVELDAQLQLLQWLQAGINYAYTDARYTNPAATAVDTAGVVHNLELGPYGDTPKQSGSVYLRVAQALPRDAGDFVARAELYGQSFFYYTNLAASLTPDVTIPGYGLLNARLEWDDVFQSSVSLALWGQNLTNKEYLVGGIGLGAVIGVNSTLPGTPRMYGVEASTTF